jgi:hypothetical protein
VFTQNSGEEAMDDNRVLSGLIFILSIGCMGILWVNTLQEGILPQLVWWTSEVLLLILAVLSASAFVQLVRGRRAGWF